MLRRWKTNLLCAMTAIAAGGTATAQVFDSGIPSGFTCTGGTCGVSGADGVVPLAPLGGSKFGYISTVGGTTMNPLGISGTTNGTVLTSSLFSAAAGQTLSFRFNYVTSDGGPFDDYAWVRLIGGGASLILFTARTIPDGNTVPGFDLPGIAAGVTLAPATTPVIPGAPDFSPLGAWNNTCYDAGCGYTGWIRAAYTIPDAGSYQLEFGVVNLLDEVWDSSLAIDYAFGAGETPEAPEDDGGINAVPEPATWLLVAPGVLAGLAMSRRRRRE